MRLPFALEVVPSQVAAAFIAFSRVFRRFFMVFTFCKTDIFQMLFECSVLFSFENTSDAGSGRNSNIEWDTTNPSCIFSSYFFEAEISITLN
jgi:hypothetical protein